MSGPRAADRHEAVRRPQLLPLTCSAKPNHSPEKRVQNISTAEMPFQGSMPASFLAGAAAAGSAMNAVAESAGLWPASVGDSVRSSAPSLGFWVEAMLRLIRG